MLIKTYVKVLDGKFNIAVSGIYATDFCYFMNYVYDITCGIIMRSTLHLHRQMVNMNQQGVLYKPTSENLEYKMSNSIQLHSTVNFFGII